MPTIDEGDEESSQFGEESSHGGDNAAECSFFTMICEALDTDSEVHKKIILEFSILVEQENCCMVNSTISMTRMRTIRMWFGCVKCFIGKKSLLSGHALGS